MFRARAGIPMNHHMTGKPHHGESPVIGRVIAWWVLGPLMGALGILILGEIVTVLVLMVLGVSFLWALGFGVGFGAWIFAIMGAAAGIAVAAKKTTNWAD
jgi:hypothetical protein